MENTKQTNKLNYCHVWNQSGEVETFLTYVQAEETRAHFVRSLDCGQGDTLHSDHGRINHICLFVSYSLSLISPQMKTTTDCNVTLKISLKKNVLCFYLCLIRAKARQSAQQSARKIHIYVCFLTPFLHVIAQCSGMLAVLSCFAGHRSAKTVRGSARKCWSCWASWSLGMRWPPSRQFSVRIHWFVSLLYNGMLTWGRIASCPCDPVGK